MDFKMIISLMAIFISIFTFVLNYWERRKTSISNIRPILVFHYTEEDIWKVVNVGNGPALNIVIAHKHKHGDWFNPVRIPTLGKEASFKLSWVESTNIDSLGANYEDFQTGVYSTTCKDDLSRVYKSPLFEFEESQLSRHWRTKKV